MTVGQSFIEKKPSSGSFVGLQFGKNTENKNVEQKQLNPLGRIGSLASKNNSASVLVPGGLHDKPNVKNNTIGYFNPIASFAPDYEGKQLSVIQDQETVNEDDTIMNENVEDSDEDRPRNANRYVASIHEHNDFKHGSILTQDEQE